MEGKQTYTGASRENRRGKSGKGLDVDRATKLPHNTHFRSVYHWHHNHNEIEATSF